MRTPLSFLSVLLSIALWPRLADGDCGPPLVNDFMVGAELPVDVDVVVWRVYEDLEEVAPTLVAERRASDGAWGPQPVAVERSPADPEYWIRLEGLQEGDRVRLSTTTADGPTAEFDVGPPAPASYTPALSFAVRRGFEWFGDLSYGNEFEAAWAEVTVEPGVLERYGELPWVRLQVDGELGTERDECSEAAPGATVFGRYTQRVFINCERPPPDGTATGTVRAVISFAGASVEYVSDPLEITLSCEPAEPPDAGSADASETATADAAVRDAGPQRTPAGPGCSSTRGSGMPGLWLAVLAVLVAGFRRRCRGTAR